MVRTRFCADLAFYHQRRWPARPVRLLSSLYLFAASPGLWILLAHRLSHWWVVGWSRANKAKWWLRLVSIPISLLELLINLFTKSDILGRSNIEGGVCLSDHGYIIFGATQMGSGTVIGARTTIGMGLADRGLPTIGRNVWIGSDCIVYGSLTIGDGATLLPGTALTRSIPAGVVMQGNPAHLVLRNFDNMALRIQPSLDAEQYVEKCLATMQGN